MKVLSRNSVKLAGGVAVGLFFLYLFLDMVDFREMAARLRETRMEFVVLSALMTLIGFVFRAVRWKYLLMPIKRVRFGRLFSAMSIGYMVSTYTPRLGEFVRPWVLGEKENLSKSAAFATIVIERIFDLLCALVLFSIFLLFFSGTIGESSFAMGTVNITMASVRKSGVFVALITLSLIVFLVALRFRREQVVTATGRLLGVLPSRVSGPILGVVSSFADGLALFQTPRNIVMAVLYSAATWFFALMAIWVMPFAYGLRPLPFSSTFFLVFMIAMGFAVPTPAGFGSFHFMCAAGFGLLGFKDMATVTSMVILLHAAGVIPINVLGIVALWKEGISLVSLKKVQAEGEGAVAGSPQAAEPGVDEAGRPELPIPNGDRAGPEAKGVRMAGGGVRAGSGEGGPRR